jgi:hypothetical protein
MLRELGLRPTRQRLALGFMLFGKGDRHVTAEMLYDEACKAKVAVSLATIYNTLHQFTDALSDEHRTQVGACFKRPRSRMTHKRHRRD